MSVMSITAKTHVQRKLKEGTPFTKKVQKQELIQVLDATHLLLGTTESQHTETD